MRGRILVIVLVLVSGGITGTLSQSSDPDDRLLCEPGDTPPANRVDTEQRVASLRQLMTANSLSAYIVLTNDDHQSEYVSPRDERRRFISGFSGSAGWAVVTTNDSALWTDSRYYLQADQELDCNWKLMRDGMPGVVNLETWLTGQLGPGAVIGTDARTVPHTQWENWKKSFEADELVLREVEDNLVDEVWGSDRPGYPTDPAFPLDEVLYAGRTWRDKTRDVANLVRQAGANALIVCALDDVAWLLNIRAFDIPFTPVVRAYAILEAPQNEEDPPIVSLYVDSSKVTPQLESHLGVGGPNAVGVSSYEQFWSDLEYVGSRLSAILLPTTFSYNLGASQAVYSRIPEVKVKSAAAPISVLKDKKNPTESQGMRNSHIRDAAALVTFLSALEAAVQRGESWDELRASGELERLRGLQPLTQGPSFASISASGANAALPHYEPSQVTNAAINTSTLYLIDSGGHYLDGTTDVTRTVHFGTPTAEQRDVYTRLLAGSITLASAVFPLGTTTSQLDILVRGELYKQGLDFGHGTTHGIGMFLGVHEAFNTTLNENFFGSQEPGYYLDGEYGMRLENIVTVIGTNFAAPTMNKTFLQFETVTLVPYETNLIDSALFTVPQVEWLNNYNAQIRAKVRPLITSNPQAVAWLDTRTQPMQPSCNKL